MLIHTLIITPTRFGISGCHLQGVQSCNVDSSQHIQMAVTYERYQND